MRAGLLIGSGAVGALLLAARPAAAQTPRLPGLVLKTNVLQPLVRGYHLEVEKAWRAHPRTSLGLTAQWYHGAITNLAVRREIQPGERISGFGAELLPRLYFPGADPELLTGFYVAAGPHVQRFQMHFYEYGYYELEQPNGLSFVSAVLEPHTETITRYGAAVLAGYQGPLELGPLVLDFYAGLGWRRTHSRTALSAPRYNTSPLDYGARGVYFPVGFKLGIRL